MKGFVISCGIVIIVVLMLSIFSFPLMLGNAYAYNHYCGPFGNGGLTIAWRDDFLPAPYLAMTRNAVAIWNDVPANITFDQVSLFEQVLVKAQALGTAGPLGQVVWPQEDSFHRPKCDSNGFLLKPATVTLNTSLLDTASNLKKVATAAHELGHVLGLGHTNFANSSTYDQQTLMYPSSIYFDTYNIFYPTLDEIRGVQSWYGTVAKTPECSEFKVNGDVIHTGTCSSSNAAMPITEKILAAGTGNALASQFSSAQSIPASDVIMMVAKVKPTVSKQSFMGVFTATSMSTSNRFMSIMADDTTSGWKVSRTTASGGGASNSSLCTSCPISTSTTYFIQIVMIGGEDAGIAVYKDDGGGTNNTPPTWLGSLLRTPNMSWGSTVYYGTGVKSPTSSNTILSNWDVKEYYNRLRDWG